ncbi:Ribosomal protein S3 [Citrus sinensis]|nr:Ribosomal protein S3 [Citrus sinensis]
MARKGNPISLRMYLNRSSDSSWFSDYYYSQLVYQDVNLRSYFGSIRPPTRLTFGFRLGRCIILHFPKRTFIHFFLPRRLKRRKKTRPGKEKGRWWTFGKVGPIGCLHSSDDTEEERNEVKGWGARKRVESIRLDDRKKQNEIRIWPKKKQRYGYHDRPPSIKKNLSKLLRVSGAFKHPKYAEVVNDIAFLIENDNFFRKTKLFKFFFPKKSRSDGPTSHLLKRTLPAVRPSLNYSVMQYLLNTKNKINFDPVVVLNHFVNPGVAEPSTMGGANAQGRSLDKRIRSRIAFFVESLTSEKKCLAESKNRLTRFIRQANDLRFAGTTKTTISLFPFFGATFFFLRDGVGVYNNLFFEDAREQLLGRLEGAEIARTECGKYGKTSCNVFHQKIDYAPAEVSTRYGISVGKTPADKNEAKCLFLNDRSRSGKTLRGEPDDNKDKTRKRPKGDREKDEILCTEIRNSLIRELKERTKESFLSHTNHTIIGGVGPSSMPVK